MDYTQQNYSVTCADGNVFQFDAAGARQYLGEAGNVGVADTTDDLTGNYTDLKGGTITVAKV